MQQLLQLGGDVPLLVELADWARTQARDIHERRRLARSEAARRAAEGVPTATEPLAPFDSEDLRAESAWGAGPPERGRRGRERERERETHTG